MNVAVLGFGPAGSAVAALLARRGKNVAVFDVPDRPPLIAGESLVPAVVPCFRKLGIEAAVAALGVYKPGVKFSLDADHTFEFSFASLSASFPQYAYNVPRPAFDHVMQGAAKQAGAQHVPWRATVSAENNRLVLDGNDVAAVQGWNGQHPDLVVDATGRRRTSARLLQIPAELGPRRDVAHFAHFEGLAMDAPPGFVNISRHEEGWSWRIPLPGKTSFGIVLDQRAAATLGDSAESRLESALHRDPGLRAAAASARRVSEAVTYANYQLVSERGWGSNWVAVGDAFGFVDPMLSPGMSLAMLSAEILDEELAKRGVAEALPSYAATMRHMIKSWMNLIAYFYDGRVFYLHDFGCALRDRLSFLPVGALEKSFRANLAAMASGFSTSSRYAWGMLRSFERVSRATPERTRPYAIR